MNGIRENLFVVILTGATVVLAGILLPWGFGIDAEIEEDEMAERIALSGQIRNLSRSDFHNQDTIEASRKGVDDLNSALTDVCQENVKWNRRNFDVVSLELLEGGTCPALPFSKDIWYQNRLYYSFVAKSHARLEVLLALLKPTTLPTEMEINSEATKLQRGMDRDELIRRKQLEEDKAGGAKPRPGVPAGLEGDMFMPGVRRSRTRTGAGDIKLGNEAIQKAQENLKLDKSRQGRIYATRDSLSIMFPKDFTGKLSPKQIWDTQSSLWVQTDILQTINQTISEEMDRQKLTDRERNVIRSPIKRLGRIIVGSQADDATPTAPKGDMMMVDEMYHGKHKSKSKTKTDIDTVVVKPRTLTRNADNSLFDVVNYSFTVLMPTRYIPVLQENLLKRNYHVILNQQIHKSLEKKTTTSRPGADSVDLYYYGTESVRWVTFTGQLLLLADWTRGDYKEDKWIYEPLMPVEVLKELPKRAWRIVDKKRVEDMDLKKKGRPLMLTAPEIKIRKAPAAAVPAEATAPAKATTAPAEATTVPTKAKKTAP